MTKRLTGNQIMVLTLAVQTDDDRRLLAAMRALQGLGGGEPLLTSGDLCERLSISRSMLTKLSGMGLEPALRVGNSPRWRLSEVEAFLGGRTREEGETGRVDSEAIDAVAG